MGYEKIVEVIKEVTGLNVPVYFCDIEAGFKGSPYFGIGHHIWDIVPEDLLDNPMFEAVDFIENKHLKYYHVGLPEEIMKKNDAYVYKVIEEQLKSNGINISLDKSSLEVFAILHEFGHAHQLLVSYNGDVEQYLADTLKESRANSYLIQTNGLGGTEQGFLLHKSIPTEKYADSYAIKYFNQVIGIINN